MTWQSGGGAEPPTSSEPRRRRERSSSSCERRPALMLGEIARRRGRRAGTPPSAQRARRGAASIGCIELRGAGAFLWSATPTVGAAARAGALAAPVPVRHQLVRRMAHGASTEDVAAIAFCRRICGARADGVDATSKIVALQPDRRTTIAEIFNERIENCDRDRDALFSRSARILAAYEFSGCACRRAHRLVLAVDVEAAPAVRRAACTRTASRVRAAAPRRRRAACAAAVSALPDRRAGSDFRGRHRWCWACWSTTTSALASRRLAFGRRGRRRAGGPRARARRGGMRDLGERRRGR